MYDCLSLYRRYPQDSLVAHMNLVGHITHESWFDDPGGGARSGVADPRFNWFEVLAAEDRRRYVIEALEGVTGFESPGSTPPTNRASLGRDSSPGSPALPRSAPGPGTFATLFTTVRGCGPASTNGFEISKDRVSNPG